jgi:DNA-binding transcriptional LysR family regulator
LIKTQNQCEADLKFSLKQLEAFVWVADLGSFKKAAERLHTTQPNISSRILKLEAVLKTSLMDRDAGSVRLTSKGQELLKLAREILQKADGLAAAADQSTLFDGTLRLGVTEMIVHTWLREFLKALKEQYPNIVVELKVDLSVNLEEELRSRSIDLAFQNGPFQTVMSGSVELGKYPWIWVASPGLGIDIKEKLKPSDLVKHSILTHARDTKAYGDVEEHFASVGARALRLVPSSNLATCLHMSIDGLGVATLPEAMVRDALKSGELIAINYPWEPEPLNFLARYDAERSPHYVATAAQLALKVANRFKSAMIK